MTLVSTLIAPHKKIETEDFFLIKPKDFLHPYNENSKYAFEAYSREYGEGKASKINQAMIFVSVYENPRKELNLPSETEETENGVNFKILRKVLCKGNKVFELKVVVLKENYQDYEERIKQTLESFKIK
ncbi:MAG: hypothetical protein ACK419_03445 [Pyrinomonadaceae bacterium]